MEKDMCWSRSKLGLKVSIKSCLAVIELNRSRIWVSSPMLLQSKKQFFAFISFSDHFGVYVSS